MNLVAASTAALAVHAGIGTLAAWYGSGLTAQVTPGERLVVYLPPAAQPDPSSPRAKPVPTLPPPQTPPEEPPQPVQPPPQPRRVVLGIDESTAQSPNWQGFAEATEHQARKSEVEQPEIAPDPGAPSAEQGPQAPPAPAAQAPGPQPNSGQLEEAASPTPQPPSPPTSPRDVPVADSSAHGPQPESGQQPGPPRTAPASPKTTQYPAPTTEAPKPEPASPAPPPQGEPDVPGAPTPKPVQPEPTKPEPARPEPTQPEPSVSDEKAPTEGLVVEVPAPALPAARAGKPVPKTERPREPAAVAADELPRELTPPEPAPSQPTSPVSPAEFVGPPLPPTGSSAPGQDAQTAAPVSPPAERPTPASPPAAGGGAPAPASGSRPALRSESDASASALVAPIAVQPGKVIAAHGLRIRTVRPRFSTTTLITASPRDATVRLTFRKNGTVRKVEFLPGGNTGFPDVDRPLVDALYSWTAKGSDLEKLPPGPEASLALEFKILMR